MNSIEEMTLAGVGMRLHKVFSLPAQPIEMPTSDRIHLWQKLLTQNGEAKLRYPVMAYSLTGVGPGDTINQTVAMMRQLATQGREDTIGALTALPVILTLNVTYLDNDRVRLLRTMANWMFARARGQLNMRLKIDGIPVDVQVTPDDQLTAPQKDMTIDAPNQYELEGTLMVRTYMSGDFGDAIKQITRVTGMVASVGVPPVDQFPPDVSGRLTAAPMLEQVETAVANFTDEDLQKNLVFDVETTLGGN